MRGRVLGPGAGRRGRSEADRHLAIPLRGCHFNRPESLKAHLGTWTDRHPGEDLSSTTQESPSPLPRAPATGSGLRPWGRGCPRCPRGPPLQHAHLPSPSPGQRLHSCNQTDFHVWGFNERQALPGSRTAECEPLAPGPQGCVLPCCSPALAAQLGPETPGLPPASPSELHEDQAPTLQIHAERGAQRRSAWAQTAGSVPHCEFPGARRSLHASPALRQPLPLPAPAPLALVTVGAPSATCRLGLVHNSGTLERPSKCAQRRPDQPDRMS